VSATARPALPPWLHGEGRPARLDVLVPDERPLGEALRRTTVLGVGAHPDDLELGAVWGVVRCRDDADAWFTGVTCTDGAGAPSRPGARPAAPDELVGRRRAEQRAAAHLGGYSAMVQLGHPSVDVRDPVRRAGLVAELTDLLRLARPEVVLAHAPVDRHPTHVAVAAATVAACRRLPRQDRPDRLLGVEGWRSLDWVADGDVVRLDVTGHDELLRQLVERFPSQLSEKRYDLAGEGRRRANATFADRGAPDTAEQVVLAVEMTELLRDDARDLTTFVVGLVERAGAEMAALVADRR
jgi:LmbE family N-acetylglucosaminyl deacetylase